MTINTGFYDSEWARLSAMWNSSNTAMADNAILHYRQRMAECSNPEDYEKIKSAAMSESRTPTPINSEG